MIAAFHTLNLDEQIARLTAVARAALAHWGLPQAELTLVAYTNNAVFHAAADDSRYALRVHRPGHKLQSWITSERALLQALADAGLPVPAPAAAVYHGCLPGLDAPVFATLTRWLPGESLSAETLTPAHAAALGRLAARLHTALDAFLPPATFQRPRLDWHGLFSPGGPYDPGPGLALFDADARQVIDAVTTRVAAVMADLDALPGAFGLIHGDLIAKNLLLAPDGELGLLDFDEAAYGYRLYDLTPLIWLLRGEPGRAAAIRDALWTAYRAERPDSAGDLAQLETLVMARHVAACRWVAGNAGHPALKGQAAAMLAGRVDEMRRYLTTGHLLEAR